MPVREHVHIISAGENIHTGYPAAFRILPDITRTIVFADSAIYEISPNQETEKSRRAVRDAVNTVKEIALSLAIPFSRELIFPPTYPSVRDTLAKIHREFPGTRFTFDISAGSKSLCVALLAMAFWLDAEVYSTFDEREMRKAPLPDRSVRSLLENPNYQTILAVLLRNGKNEGKTVIPAWVSRQYIFKQLGAVYIPIRTKRKKPDTAPVQPVTSKRSRKPAAVLTHGTFSDFMRSLRENGLVVEELTVESRREKMYRITEKGEIAFRFFSRPTTNSLVRSMLEKG